MKNKNNKMVKEVKGENVQILGHWCYRCNHQWVPRGDNVPEICPKCKSPYWKKPKTRFLKNDKKKLNKNHKKDEKTKLH